jgi:MFS family permease
VSVVFGFIYFGFLVSVFLRAFIVDSYGRRPLMIFFNGIMALGSILSISSINIWVTGAGLFLLNCGSDGAMKFSFNYLAEYFDPQLR